MLDAVFDLIGPALNAAFAVIALASAVAAITPTPRDDAILGKAYRVLEWLALNFGHAKDAPPNRTPPAQDAPPSPEDAARRAGG